MLTDNEIEYIRRGTSGKALRLNDNISEFHIDKYSEDLPADLLLVVNSLYDLYNEQAGCINETKLAIASREDYRISIKRISEQARKYNQIQNEIDEFNTAFAAMKNSTT